MYIYISASSSVASEWVFGILSLLKRRGIEPRLHVLPQFLNVPFPLKVNLSKTLSYKKNIPKTCASTRETFLNA